MKGEEVKITNLRFNKSKDRGPILEISPILVKPNNIENRKSIIFFFLVF